MAEASFISRVGQMLSPTIETKSNVAPAPDRSFTLGLTDELGAFLRLGSQKDPTISTASLALYAYEQSGMVANVINMVADPLSMAEPVLETQDGERIEEHPILDLFENPCTTHTRELFFRQLAVNYLCTGEYFCGAIGDIEKPPTEIQPLNSKVATHVLDGVTGRVLAFHITDKALSGKYTGIEDFKTRQRRYIDFETAGIFTKGPVRELIQVRDFSTRDNALLRGQSRLWSASREVWQNIQGGKHNLSLLNEGGRVGLVFHFDSDMSDDEYEETRQRVLGQYAGVMGQRIGVTSGGKLDIKTAGQSMQDMDYGNLQEHVSIRLAMAFHIPLPMVTALRQTLNNYGEGRLAIFDDAIIPFGNTILGGLGRALLPRYGEDPRKLRLVVDQDKIGALVRRRTDELKKRREIGIEQVNELRKEIPGLQPDPHGNVILVPGTLVTLEEITNPPDPPTDPIILPPIPGDEENPNNNDDD